MMVDEEYLNLFDKFTKLPTKVCIKCKKNKPVTEYYIRSHKRHDLRTTGTMKTFPKSDWQSRCKTCDKEYLQKYSKEKPFQRRWTLVKSRATRKQLPFNLTVEYLESIWTKKCPVLGLELDINGGKTRNNSAQIDCLVPDKGYVKGNVSWLSARANRLKSNGTAKEHMQISQWMLGQSDDS